MSQEQVYIAKAGSTIKVGVSKNPENRIRQLNTANSSEVQLESVLDSLDNRGKTAREWESEIHDHLEDYHMSGEWFDIGALGEVHEFIGAYETDVELTDRQAHALGVAFTLQGNFPDYLYQLDGWRGEIEDLQPETKILKTIVREYDLPHGVCQGCGRIAYYHLADGEEICQLCGTPNNE